MPTSSIRAWALGLTVVACGLAACAPSHRRVDPDVDDMVGGGGTESSDVRTMADRMARDLLASDRLKSPEGRPTLYLSTLENRGSHPINRRMVLEQIQSKLVEHGIDRLRVLDRSLAGQEAIQQERRAKREGALAGGAKKGLLGSDYLLTGTVDTISKKGADGMSSDYWVYTFRVVDLESSELVWSKKYDFKWAGNKPAVYR